MPRVRERGRRKRRRVAIFLGWGGPAGVWMSEDGGGSCCIELLEMQILEIQFHFWRLFYEKVLQYW